MHHKILLRTRWNTSEFQHTKQYYQNIVVVFRSNRELTKQHKKLRTLSKIRIAKLQSNVI